MRHVPLCHPADPPHTAQLDYPITLGRLHVHELNAEWNAPLQQFGGFGYAMSALGDQKNPEAAEMRAKFLAAQMMAPEGVLLNVKMASGSNAASAIELLEKKMRLDAKIKGWTISEQDYRNATKYMHKALDKGADIREKAMKGMTDYGVNTDEFSASLQPTKEFKPYTDADLAATAKKYGMTIEQVRKKLEERKK